MLMEGFCAFVSAVRDRKLHTATSSVFNWIWTDAALCSFLAS